MVLGVACSINYCVLLLPYSSFYFHSISRTKKGRKANILGVEEEKKRKKKWRGGGGGGGGKKVSAR